MSRYYYFDKYLTIRNRVEVSEGEYTLVYYEDYFLEEWVGNLNLIKDGKSIFHATVYGEPYTKEQLKAEIKDWINKANFLRGKQHDNNTR